MCKVGKDIAIEIVSFLLLQKSSSICGIELLFSCGLGRLYCYDFSSSSKDIAHWPRAAAAQPPGALCNVLKQAGQHIPDQFRI